MCPYCGKSLKEQVEKKSRLQKAKQYILKINKRNLKYHLCRLAHQILLHHRVVIQAVQVMIRVEKWCGCPQQGQNIIVFQILEI